MVGGTRNPPTLIQRPFANATRAREMTKFGKMAVTKTTRDSAATRSKKIHITQVKKASPLGRKLESQYETMEKRREIRTGVVSWVNDAGWDMCHVQRNGRPMRKFETMNGVAP